MTSKKLMFSMCRALILPGVIPSSGDELKRIKPRTLMSRLFASIHAVQIRLVPLICICPFVPVLMLYSIMQFTAYREQVMLRTVEEAAELCGINPDDIYLAADWIGQSKGFLSLWTMGMNQSVVGVNKNLSLINLHLITGR